MFEQHFLRRVRRAGKGAQRRENLHYMHSLRDWAGLWPDTLHFGEAQHRQDDGWFRLSRAPALTEYELPVIGRERARGSGDSG